jgi:hypothetical protein
MRGQGDRHLKMQIAPFAYPDSPPQTVSLSLNGRSLGVVLSLREGWQVVEATLPQSALRQGLNTLSLTFDHTASPGQVLPDADDDRPLAAAMDWIEITIE